MLQLHFKPLPPKENHSEIQFHLICSSYTNGTMCETILYRFLSEVMGLSRFEWNVNHPLIRCCCARLDAIRIRGAQGVWCCIVSSWNPTCYRLKWPWINDCVDVFEFASGAESSVHICMYLRYPFVTSALFLLLCPFSRNFNRLCLYEISQ